MAINTVINTNMMALTAHRNLGAVGNRQNKANQRLSSGKKINSAADDAAGLAISEKMKAQIKGLDMASKNSEDAISLIQTAEGSLTEVNNMLTRVRELTVQAANGTNQKEDRVKIAEEVAQLLTEIDSISDRTEFNEKKLNDGSFEKGFFQIGANKGQKLELGIGNMSVMGIGADEIMDVFGIQKNITEVGVKSDTATLSEPAMSKSITDTLGKITTTDDGKIATYSVTVRDAQGREEVISVDLKLSKDDHSTEEKLANAVVEALKDNKEFSSKFDISVNSADKKIEFTGKEVGYTVTKIDVTGDVTEVKGTIDTGNTKGSVESATLGKLDISKMKDGDTVRIGNKIYTFKGNEEDVDVNKNQFNKLEDLSKLLAQEGIVLDVEDDSPTYGSITAVNEGSKIAGTYEVKARDVSDDGAQYSKALDSIDKALKSVTTQRAVLGANQNRLEYTINNLNLSSENLSAAKSRIEDTDMAKEMMNLTQANVLQQAATSILAQANQAPQSITQLLG